MMSSDEDELMDYAVTGDPSQQGYQQVRSRRQKRSRDSIEFINIKAKRQNAKSQKTKGQKQNLN